MKLLKKLIAVIALLPALVLANEAGFPLEHAPDRSADMAALQNGAKLFVNYCLNCHSASAMRYNRLKDIGLTDDQIKHNLLFTGEKVGDLMKTTMAAKDAKAWFGAVPPDLSVIARARASAAGSGADWLYTYLRSYYKDESRPTGWNNMVFPNVGMPHVLWQLQGVRNAKFVEEKDPHDESKSVHKFAGFDTVSAGSMTAVEYDNTVGDLVGYLQWMGEPAQATRKRLGVIVVLFMALLATFAWRLNASYWKEVK
ncbi:MULTISPECIES: cytochrome c1 [unclassified Undibacterium]|uniref:cytochrome c1 n=1 Tax=unclassified Undibacterium TaxID=2630295 RepID=UPI002AC951B6|nr:MULTISPECIES: cytochrome c1 [unclassified Undibacterium]MEB0139742.1 cytochrome c1 [Undibacterium sp. CCC2.1]MEB0172623.1 cytochrome c1 [Undibacterium sp. CCC1.1]MEB0176396.1 cytochrome c1 [Undibacterium sp. CCC3.4]MEB0215746.1 cytochrome c1 [Undibacterium sp. 5I2]WPX45167.1 cytochrome c1 [Undibacterium sp. CCC3.4]